MVNSSLTCVAVAGLVGCNSPRPGKTPENSSMMVVQAVIYTTRLSGGPLAEGGPLTPEQSRTAAARLREEEQRGNITVISRPSVAVNEDQKGVIAIGEPGSTPRSPIRFTCLWRGDSIDCSVAVGASAPITTRVAAPLSGESITILKGPPGAGGEGQEPVMVLIRAATAG